MSALLTQELEENLKILLISNKSQLSHLTANKVQQTADIEVVSASFKEFRDGEIDNESWYKVVLLIENTQDENLPKLDESFLSLNKVIVVMPITTTVSSGVEDNILWDQQVKYEKKIFDYLVKKIDISRFILYSDLVRKESGLLSFLFNKLDRGLLIDPNIELRLQTMDSLVSKLSSLFLKSRKNPIIVSGEKKLSGVFIQKIKSLYLNQRQVNLPLKRIQLSQKTHPIFSTSQIEFNHEVVEKDDSIFRKTMSMFASIGKNDGKKKTIDNDYLRPPVKNKQVRKKELSSLVKIRVDLEHDLDQEENPKKEIKSKNNKPSSIDSLFNDYRSQKKQKHLQKLAKSTRVGFRKVKNQKFLFGGGVLVGLVALSIILSATMFFVNMNRAQINLLSYLESRSLPVTAQQKKLTQISKVVKKLDGKLSFINKWFSTPYFSDSLLVVDVSRLIVELSSQVESFNQVTIALFNKIIDGDGDGSIESVNKESIEVFKTLSLLSAELKNFPLEKLSPEQSQLLSSYQGLIVAQEKKINQFQQLSPLLSSLLAHDGEKTYALVLQNNQELRPTGGFIQAVALLTFKDGSLISFQVEDVYAIDQQLKATVVPPDEVRRFLGEERWFLRDSNWNPSFPESAAQIKWFLEKSISANIDGVIGINLNVLEEIIGVLDQLEVDEYNEVLTKRNLSERMEFHSEVQLVESSEQRDYSELILFKLLTDIQQLSPDKVIPLLSTIVEMADAKELLISVFSEDSKGIFESLGWDGALIEPACPAVFNTNDCLVDSLMQVEANVGVNKANYYLERQIDHSIVVTSQEITHKRSITYKNKAQTNSWPKGSYRSFVRFYLPAESNFKSININGQLVAVEQLVLKEELGRKVVGVLIDVAVKSELKLNLEYSIPNIYQAPFTYSFFDQKQPGARKISPRIFLKHDPDLSPVLIAPQAEVQGDVVVFSPTKDIGHMFIGASFD